MTWFWKVPSPLPSNTDTVPDPFATARSVRPSPVKSPATMATGLGPHGVGDLVLEGAVAVAQQHRHVVRVAGVVATARSVRPSPLKSPATMASGIGPHGVGDLVLEGAVAVAQQHRHGVVALVCDGQVGAAVAVEVPRHKGDWVGPHGVGDLGLEGAVAVAQQHRHGVVARVGDGQVGAAVAGEVPRHDGIWLGPHGVGRPGSGRCRRRCPATPTRRRSSRLATARSVRPSPLKSPATRASGLVPHGVGRPGSGRCRRRCPATPTRRWSRRWRRPGRSGRRR